MDARVLIVDDDPVALVMLEEALKAGSFGVIRAYGADDALRKVKLQKPDVVMTDLEMPKVNGVALIAMIREDPDTQGTPIIAVTSHLWEDIGQAAGQVGCDAYISKPFSPAKLIEKVRECLATRHAGLEPLPRPKVAVEPAMRVAAPAPVPPGPAVAEIRRPLPPSEKTGIFDRATFLEYVDGNRDQAQRAIGVLLAKLPAHLEAIRKAVASQDSEALRTTAHALKGAVAFFAAPAAVAAAFRLEMIGRSGDLTLAGATYFDLERALAHLVEALNEFAREVGGAPAAPKAADEPVTLLHLVRGGQL